MIYKDMQQAAKNISAQRGADFHKWNKMSKFAI